MLPLIEFFSAGVLACSSLACNRLAMVSALQFICSFSFIFVVLVKGICLVVISIIALSCSGVVTFGQLLLVLVLNGGFKRLS
jgi:hypothetical protein